MEAFLLFQFMFLCAQNEFFLYAVAIPTFSIENPLCIKDGESLNMTCKVDEDAASVIWIRNSFSALQITNATDCSFRKLSSVDTYNYNVTCDQQKRFSMLKHGFNSSDDNTIWSCRVRALNSTDLGTSPGVRVYICKFPSNLPIEGDNISTLYDGDTVALSVSTGCINPSDSAHYNVTWKYVEANNTAEKNFDERIIMQNVSSIGCTNAYENNLKFSLNVTNKLNTGNTDLNISQVKMTLTIVGIDFIATKNVLYTLKPNGTNRVTVQIKNITGEHNNASSTSSATDSTSGTTTTTTITTTTTTITTTTTTGTSTLNSTSMPSSTSNVSIDNTTMKPTTTGPGASTTNTSSMLISSTTDNSNNTSGSTTTSNTTNNGTKSNVSDTNIKVIVPAIVVPCGLLIIGAIILLVVWCVRRRAGKNVPKSQDGIGIKYRDKNKDRWKPSTGHGKVTNNHGEYITPDGFIIYPGPAARSTARSYKDNKSHGGTDQYSRPDSWTYHHQADYTPNTYTAYTHKGKHRVTDQYSEPYTEAYGYQTAHLPSTHKSARTYEQKAKNSDNERHQQASHPMATSRLAYGQTAYYPQTGFYGQSSHDAYYRGDGQYSYGQMSRSHRDYNGHKQQRKYYSQYEMTDYRHNKIGDMHTKQGTDFYY